MSLSSLQATKFSPDLVFTKITKSYNRSDVFNTEELKRVIGLHADVVVDSGETVSDWRANQEKYSKLMGIRSVHNFVIAVTCRQCRMQDKTAMLQGKLYECYDTCTSRS